MSKYQVVRSTATIEEIIDWTHAVKQVPVFKSTDAIPAELPLPCAVVHKASSDVFHIHTINTELKNVP